MFGSVHSSAGARAPHAGAVHHAVSLTTATVGQSADVRPFGSRLQIGGAQHDGTPGGFGQQRRQSVPREFLGLGRQFREQIADADDLAARAMIRVFKPLAARADRSAIPRPEMLQDAARIWRQSMPSMGLLDSNIQRSRRELHIREVRLGVGTFHGAAWDDGASEPVVAILLVDLLVAPGTCRLMVDAAAQFSLHALARWYQRAPDNSEAALLSDLARPAAVYGQIIGTSAMTGNHSFLCAAAGGQWAGSLTQRLSEATGRQEPVLNIRTFLPDGARQYAMG
jgi:hypothetical protein